MKKNPIIASIEAKYQKMFDNRIAILSQLCCDAAFIAAHKVFQMGEGRAEQFRDELERELHWISAIIQEDQKGDQDLVYAKTKIDESLKGICGAHFQPWEVRYGGMRYGGKM